MSDAIRKAGLPPYCKAHGLRKAAARRLAEAGCSTQEIMAVTGHKTLSEVERYTRAAEQERLNAAAMAKQLENKKVANSPGQIGKHIEAKEKKSRMALPRGLEPCFRRERRATGTSANDGEWQRMAVNTAHLTVLIRACSALFGPVYWRKVGEGQPCRDQLATPIWRPAPDERA